MRHSAPLVLPRYVVLECSSALVEPRFWAPSGGRSASTSVGDFCPKPLGLKVLARPLEGDHLHLGFHVRVDGRAAPRVWHDRHYVEAEGYEDAETVCPGDQSSVAYHKLYPHTGVHTHCDGLIHVHPWSAPRALRSTGVDVVAGLYFDTLGINFYPPATLRLCADCPRYASNATHAWVMVEYDERGTAILRWHSHFDRFWLGRAFHSIHLVYGERRKLDALAPKRLAAPQNFSGQGAGLHAPPHLPPYPRDA